MDCIMKKIKRAYILLFVCVMTVCFSGCQNQSDVSSEDVENSLFMEWCSRFRASNEPLILITFPDGTSTSLVGENAVTAASDMEKALTALTADDFSVLQDCSASTDAPYIIVSDNLFVSLVQSAAFVKWGLILNLCRHTDPLTVNPPVQFIKDNVC